jgi:hypothetical protein
MIQRQQERRFKQRARVRLANVAALLSVQCDLDRKRLPLLLGMVNGTKAARPQGPDDLPTV